MVMDSRIKEVLFASEITFALTLQVHLYIYGFIKRKQLWFYQTEENAGGSGS